MKGKMVVLTLVIIGLALALFGAINRTNIFTEDNGDIALKDIKINDTINSSKLLKTPELVMFIAEKDRKSIALSTLKEAKSISEIIPNYPSSWISGYKSVEIIVSGLSGSNTAVGTDDIITPEQKIVLNEAVVSSNIELNVKYQNENSVTNQVEDRIMNVTLVVIPHKQAEFIDGYDKLISKINEESSAFIDYETFEGLTFSFLVNEDGAVTETKILESSGDLELDRKFTNMINALPNWNPASNKLGQPVVQRFQFDVFSSLSEKGC
ncbi:MAG: TonB family protein [Salibacteraceae bacterium]